MTGTVSETTVALESSLEEGVRLAGVSVNAATSVAEDLPPEETKETDQSGPLRPPINASGSNNAASGNLSHPKRFSAVNINKKFLEQNSSVSGSGQPSSNSVVAKSGVAVARPTVQPSTTHSRLVTTKLTAGLQSSSASGPSWSRPSSATPPVPPTSSSLPSVPAPVPSATAPQLPHAGKVIQPQPRTTPSSASAGGSQKDGSGNNKPAWGNVKTAPTHTHNATARAQNDFPTAAEVAQVGKAKPVDTRETADVAAAHKRARMEEADTFRGVHLDPNAHHWDEMEEDDDNFLDGVIEFGDGRQYEVQSVEHPQSSPPPSTQARPSHDDGSSQGDGVATTSNVLVSKEERFEDDFDRSWPPSKPSPSISQRDFSAQSHPTASVSATSSQSIHSPQESSRVLFNERSNRLEPYSNIHPSYRTSQGPYSKKGNQSDVSSSPPESRSHRDFAPQSQPQSMQLLQKPGPLNDFHPRTRRFSGGFDPGPTGTDRSWSRDTSRRDMPLSPPPHTPSLDAKRSRDQHHPSGFPASSSGYKERERDFGGGSRGSRTSTVGQPPLLSPRGQVKDFGRQVPPHLSQMPSPTSSTHKRHPPPELPGRPSLPSELHSSEHPPALPSPPTTSRSQLSDTHPLLSAISELDMDEVRKDVMQSAAARAKERRKQEEEEREKEKERARKKALELEERFKTVEIDREKADQLGREPSASEVDKFIEDAVKSATLQQENSVQNTAPRRASSTSQSAGLAPRRPPSLQGVSRQPMESSRPRKMSQSSASAPLSATTPAEQADSWRSKASPLVAATPRQVQAMDPGFAFPDLSSSSMDSALVVNVGEELEVVDFSDLGKFFGVTDAPATPADPQPEQPGTTPYSPRPTASDFFEDGFNSGGRGARSTWRQRSSHEASHNQLPMPVHNGERKDSLQSVELSGSDATSIVQTDSLSTGAQFASASFSTSYSKETTEVVEPHRHNLGSSHTPTQPNAGSQRTPRAAAYKEADMSAWDNAMSRIKGALHVMQASDTNRGQLVGASTDTEMPSTSSSLPPAYLPPRSPRWIPPALRVQSDAQSLEDFRVTGCEPPRSPRKIVVQLPRVSRRLEQPNKRQFHQSKALPPHVRWDILSWDPPVEGMSRRDFSLNDVLFRKPSYKAKHKFRVALPKTRLRASNTTGPKANLPANVPKFTGAFGRSTAADGLSTWRKPKSPSLKGETEVSALDATLDTVSKSPPPELSSNGSSATTTPKPDTLIPAKEDNPQALSRSRSQPKMPAGSAVAFYRDSRIDTDTSVKFIVNSELDEPTQSRLTLSENPIITLSSPTSNALPRTTEEDSSDDKAMVNGLKSPPTSPELTLPLLVQSKAESKSSDDSIDHPPITPPTRHASATWAKPLGFNIKESPARPPDPEHLKAVWSQASDKATLPSVNSLEGIADDLTALPFTLQDVKSEDGETPPPSVSSAPSRMSLHDVTRAFQQVPASSSNSSTHRGPPLSQTSVAAPLVQRPPTYAYPLPPLNHGMRPNYVPYSSSMVTASPNSPIVYPHTLPTSPVPSRMQVNGHTPLYSPSLWMPLPAGPPAQNHGRMMRPLASPYSVPYPPSTPTIYPPPLPSTVQNPLQQNGSQTRGRMPAMSPVMSHTGAHPNMQMYAASPVLMHAPVVQLPQGYISMPHGRRNDEASGHSPMQQPVPIHSPPHNSGFSPVPSTSFVRSTW